jgi:hypothetical protein
LNQEQFRRLARLGAMARLQQLESEEAAIRAAFPELFGRAGGQGRRVSAGTDSQDTAAPGRKRARKRRRNRSAMSAEARKAVSVRMRKYWAERRKAKAAK